MSSYNYSSTSFSSSSDTGPGGQVNSKSYTEQTSSNDRDGTTVHRRVEESGKEPIEETTTYPASDRVSGGSSAGKIEDVSNSQEERDKQYEERMEDEYAKREGGA